MNEGEYIGQVNGLLTPEAAEVIKAHQLIDGKEYKCDICYKAFIAPFVFRCVCGLKVCNNCEKDHESW